MNMAGLIQKRTLLVGIIAVLLCLPFQAVYADDPDHCGDAGVGEAGAEAYVPKLPTPYTLEQPFGGRASVSTLGEYVQLVYSYAAGIIGIIAVVLIMAGGIMWIGAAGNEQVIGTAKEIIISALTAVVIIVLSFAILRIINPSLITQKFVVPKIPIKGCVVPDGVVTSIPAHANLTGSGSLCPGASAALIQIADAVAVGCPTCKIGIGSTYRSSDSQEPLYACYQAAVEAGYFAADGKTKTTPGCPADSGCSGCNLAAKPCCSNHRQGTAIDAWFEIPTADDVQLAKTSAGKLAQEFNNGGGDAALKQNQLTLKLWMETPIGGKQLFKGIDSEWWHFDYQGDCNEVSGCTLSDTYAGYAANYYCVSNDRSKYIVAGCAANVNDPSNPGAASCGGIVSGYSEYTDAAPWTIISGCQANQEFIFDETKLSPTSVIHAYTSPPTCTAVAP